jgi:hypothetical protein
MNLAQRRAYVVGLVIVIALLVVGLLSFQPSNQQTSNTSSSSSASSFQLLKINEIVPYDAGCIVLEGIGHSCPTKSADTNASSLSEVELAAYQGTDYYAGNFSVGPFSAAKVAYLEVWFTNSTIFCISPSYSDHATCPVFEPLPLASW